MKKTVVFATATYSLAETQRMTQIAKEVANNGSFDVIVAHYTPKDESFSFSHIIEDEHLNAFLLEPHMTKELSTHIFEVDRGEKMGSIIPIDILKKRIDSETTFLKSRDIACVVTGFCLSFNISCRLLDIPIISVYSGSMLWWLSKEPKTVRIPDLLAGIPGAILPRSASVALMKWFSYDFKWLLRNENKILVSNGKKPFSGFMDYFLGDYLFISDIPEFIPIENIPPNTYYTGSLIGRLNSEIPDEVHRAVRYAKKHNLPLIYFSMGSSGRTKFIKKCISMFKNEQMTVISPMKKMICNDDDRDTLRVPENVFMTDWLPADQVNPMCDAAIIHGGQGTVYTAIMSETPFCAIGNGNPEQEFNVEAATEHGFAKLFRRKSVRPSDILGGLKKLLNDKNAKTEIKRMASLLKRPEWNGEKRAAKKLEELFA